MSARRVAYVASLATLTIAGGLALLPSVTACSGPPKGTLESKVSTRASPGTFRTAGVGVVFERRCGSLDCHGNTSRNLRIYSSRGLRLPNDAGLTTGGGDTTLDENTANYRSILSLEPEVSNLVIDGDDPYQLLILKKPLEIERHKGGPSLTKGDDAESCIVSWLKEDPDNKVNKAACTNAAIFPIQ